MNTFPIKFNYVTDKYLIKERNTEKKKTVQFNVLRVNESLLEQ
jgi:hypothetical protein